MWGCWYQGPFLKLSIKWLCLPRSIAILCLFTHEINFIMFCYKEVEKFRRISCRRFFRDHLIFTRTNKFCSLCEGKVIYPLSLSTHDLNISWSYWTNIVWKSISLYILPIFQIKWVVCFFRFIFSTPLQN